MQIVSVIAFGRLHSAGNYQKKNKNFTILSRESVGKPFKYFPGLKNKIERLSRTAKNPRLFRDVGT